MNKRTFSINLVSVPKDTPIRKFFNEEFYSESNNKASTDNGLFKLYRKGLIDYANTTKESTQKQKEGLTNLYKPIPYFVFGQYDLALISKVDDFTIGNRIFKPVHTYRTEETNYSYKYQIISGVSSKQAKWNKDITLSEDTKGLPWLAIVRLKINSGLLIGGGVSIIDSIDKILQQNGEKHDLKIASMHTFDTYEITLMVFAKTCKNIQEYIADIRKLNLNEFSPKTKENLRRNSLLGNYYQSEDINDFYKSHIFTSTNSTYGLQLDYFEGKVAMPLAEKLNLLTFVDVKAGHYNTLFSQIQNEQFKISSCAGEDTMLIETEWQTNKPETLPYFILNKKIETSNHFNRVNTKMYYPRATIKDSDENSVHPIYLSDKINDSKIKFTTGQIRLIRTKLGEMGVSKAVCDRLLTVINDYNEGITDVHLFTYFIELKGFLFIAIEDVIKKYDKEKLESTHAFLNYIIRHFEKAFYSRLQQGYNYSQFTDINIEHNGGVQSLLSSFNEIYVSLVNVLTFNTQRKDYAFIYVTGENTAKSNATRLKVNYFHLFHPELYLAIVAKEAFNGFETRMDAEQTKIYTNINNKATSNFSDFVNQYTFKHQCLKDYYNIFIKKNIVQYFIIDYWVLTYWFNNDFNLYYKWVMATLLTTPENYIAENKVDDYKFVTTMHRVLALLMFIDIPHKKKILNYILFDPYDSLLQKHWFKYIRQIIEFLSYENSPSFNVFKDIMNEPYRFANKLLEFWCEEDLGDNKEQLTDLTPYEQRQKIVQNKSDLYFNSLYKGDYIKYNKGHGISIHLTALSIAYLRHCTHSPESIFLDKNDTQNQIQRKIVLPRQKGKPVIGIEYPAWENYQKYYHPYMFDPAGGIFLNTMDSRAKYLKIRTAFYFSITDCTLINKQRHFHPAS